MAEKSGPQIEANASAQAQETKSARGALPLDPLGGFQVDGMERTPSGIPGLDQLLGGGYPTARATLISGTAGSGKTLAAIQFATDGAEEAGHGAVYVSFEEPADQLRRTMSSLNRDAAKLEKENKLALIDAALPSTHQAGADGQEEPLDASDVTQLLGGRFELSGLLARITSAAERVNGKRVVLDSLDGLTAMFLDSDDLSADLHMVFRAPLARLIAALKGRGLTVLITSERDSAHGRLTRFGLEEFVTDGVILLRSNQYGERRRRTVEITKLRSCVHVEGESPLVIEPGFGLNVMPLTQIRLTQDSGVERTTTGVKELDRMCGGGFLRDSVILISGATGTGKTLLGMHFAKGALQEEEKVVVMSYEESRNQYLRNADAFNFDFEDAENQANLIFNCVYPESMSLEGHLLSIEHLLDTHKPGRIVIDSLSALERVGPEFAFRQFLIALSAIVKQRRVTLFLTAGGGSFGEQTRISEQHISTLNDTIILLRYLDIQGRVERSLTVLKMRGSGHAREHRRYRIGDEGIILSGPRGDAGTNVAGERVSPALSSQSEMLSHPKES